MMYPFVFYGRIAMTSVSILHIGGESEENFELAVNGDQQFVIPASGLVGSIRHYLESVNKSDTDSFFGDSGHTGRVYVYDAVLDQYSGLETRNGIQIDPKYGTAKKGKLYTRYYLAEGTKSTIEMKAFCESREEFIVLFCSIANGIEAGGIAFGANRSNGAGCFKVDAAEYRILDLQKEQDLQAYLSDDPNWKGTPYTPASATKSLENTFVLEAEIPNGLLVKDGEKHRGINSINLVHTANGKETAYIPGTTIKGLMKAQAARILKYYEWNPELLAAIFGSDSEGTPSKGHIFVSDVNIDHPSRRIYARVKTDRLKGSAFSSGLIKDEVLSTKAGQTISVTIRIDPTMDTELQRIARILVYLILRDLGAGYLSIGSGNNVGYGRLRGTKLSVGEQVCKFRYEQEKMLIEIPEELKKELEGDLKILQGGKK